MMRKRILELESMPEIREYNKLNKIMKLCPHKVSINGICMVCQSTSEAELKIGMDSSEYSPEVVETIRNLYNHTEMEDFKTHLIRRGYTVTIDEDEDEGELLRCPRLMSHDTHCIEKWYTSRFSRKVVNKKQKK